MKCKKCIHGVIMKQIAIAEFIPEPCDCVIKHEEKLYEEWFNNLRANP